MTIVSHRERQFMLQYLRSGGWAKAANLPPGRKLIESLLNKGLPAERSGQILSGLKRATRICADHLH
jgi:hypothetical protein